MSRGLFFPKNYAEVEPIVLWACHKLNERPELFREPYSYAIVDAEKGIVAAILLHDYTGKNISISLAMEPGTILSRSIVHDVLSVPFKEPLDVARMTAFVDETNMRSVSLIKGLGFTEEGRIRKHFGDRDGIVFGLLREEFYGGRYGRRTNRTEGGRTVRQDAIQRDAGVG